MKENIESKIEKNISSVENEKKPLLTFARELWFSVPNGDLEKWHSDLEAHKITSTVRLGDRSSAAINPKGSYGEGRYINVKLQKEDGTFDSFEKEVVICSTQTKKVGDLLSEDFAGSTFEVETKEDLLNRLEEVYQQKLDAEDIVSLVKFEYQETLQDATDLMRTGVISLAEQPQSNAQNLDAKSYTLPLLGHDYPAKTAVMWNEAYKAFSLEVSNAMVVADPDFSQEILEVLRRDSKYLGGGAGVGFKDEAIKYLDELDEMARAIGSVNFILKTPEGKLRGYNTDGLGYANSLEGIFEEKGEKIAGKRALILGAGGTGNAVAFALAQRGMNLTILNRTFAKAQELAEKINNFFGKEVAKFGGEDRIAEEVMQTDAVINVSTKGAAGALEDYSALAPALFPANAENIFKNLAEAERVLATISKETILSDIVLTEIGTPFLRSAREKEFKVLDGVPMVVKQGVEAFWILHGSDLEKKGVSKDQVAELMKKAAGL